MRYFSHDQLHELMDSDEKLKELSDEVHAGPAPRSFEDIKTSKRRMIEIYTKAVGCDCFEEAEDHIEKVIQLIEKHYITWSAWKKGGNPEFSKALADLKKEFKTQKKCCSAGGNDYICFCDEK